MFSIFKRCPLFATEEPENPSREDNDVETSTNRLKIGLGIAGGALAAAAVTALVIYLIHSGTLANALQSPALSQSLGFVQTHPLIEGFIIGYGGTIALGGLSYLGYRVFKQMKQPKYFLS